MQEIVSLRCRKGVWSSCRDELYCWEKKKIDKFYVADYNTVVTIVEVAKIISIAAVLAIAGWRKGFSPKGVFRAKGTHAGSVQKMHRTVIRI